MKFIFRVDASTQIGTGHVMRCLTLAESLKRAGGDCFFICRSLPGNLIELIKGVGYRVYSLKCDGDYNLDHSGGCQNLKHESWLGADWITDHRETKDILKDVQPDWLIIDHYSLDSRWEEGLRDCVKKIMVIDDLADRRHDADLLLDQNLGRKADDYIKMLPAKCKVMVGPKYALLKLAFNQLREKSLVRKRQAIFKNILISMGGVDSGNVTTQLLLLLKKCQMPEDCNIKVVMGQYAPWLEHVRQISLEMPFATELVVNTPNMAKLMAESDFSIGAAGSTSWERCCLGLPSLVLPLAFNQLEVIKALESAGACIVFDLNKESMDDFKALEAKIYQLKRSYLDFVNKSSELVDGLGCQRVVKKMIELTI